MWDCRSEMDLDCERHVGPGNYSVIGLYPPYWVKKYLAERCKVSRKVFDYHAKNGKFPEPSQLLAGVRCYSEADVSAILEYFRNRMCWQR